MRPFNPRSKNRKYLSRSTHGQLEFTSCDSTETFSHQHGIMAYQTTNEGRDDQGFESSFIYGRDDRPWRQCFRDPVGIRKFDEPDDYYRDPRDPQ